VEHAFAKSLSHLVHAQLLAAEEFSRRGRVGLGRGVYGAAQALWASALPRGSEPPRLHRPSRRGAFIESNRRRPGTCRPRRSARPPPRSASRRAVAPPPGRGGVLLLHLCDRRHHGAPALEMLPDHLAAGFDPRRALRQNRAASATPGPPRSPRNRRSRGVDQLIFPSPLDRGIKLIEIFRWISSG
jgi:hypothetical protein